MARNEKSIDALLVFAHSTGYLKDQVIRAKTGGKQHCDKDIEWVISVPAIWEPAAKQFKRDTRREISYLQATMYHFVYHINTIALH